MNNAEANRPIANRFFEAFDALVAMGKIKSVRSYCDPNGVDRRNMELLRRSYTKLTTTILAGSFDYRIWC